MSFFPRLLIFLTALIMFLLSSLVYANFFNDFGLFSSLAMFATCEADRIAAIALICATTGVLMRPKSRMIVWIGMTGFILAGLYSMIVTREHGGFDATFGPSWREKVGYSPYAMNSRRAWSLPKVPEPKWTRDIVYAETEGVKLLADLWTPNQSINASKLAIIYLHGGAWYLLDKDVLTRSFFKQLTAQGHVVLDVAYRMPPEVGMKGMIGDVFRAIDYVKTNAGEHGMEKIVLMGASAGGHLALLAAHGSHDPRLIPEDLQSRDLSVHGVVSYYGIPSLFAYHTHMIHRAALAGYPNPLDAPDLPSLPEPEGFENKMNEWMMGRPLTRAQTPPTPPHWRMMRELLGGFPEQVPENYTLYSPISHIHPGSPPTLLFQGQKDSIVPLDSVRRFAGDLRKVGGKVVLVEYPFTEHAFDVFWPALSGPAARGALFDCERFLELVAKNAV